MHTAYTPHHTTPPPSSDVITFRRRRCRSAPGWSTVTGEWRVRGQQSTRHGQRRDAGTQRYLEDQLNYDDLVYLLLVVLVKQ